MVTKQKPRCALYARRSREDKAKKYSLKNQFDSIRKLAIKNDHQIVKKIYDDGKTGRNFERKGIQEVFDLAMNEEIEFLYVWKIDRFARNLVEGVLYAIVLFMNDVKIVTKDRLWDFNKIGNMIMFVIDQYSSQKESDDIGLRTSLTKKKRFEEGYWVHSFIPFGYNLNDKDKRLFIDTNAKSLIKNLFETYKEKKSLKDVIRAHEQEFKDVFSNTLKPGRLKSILKNSIYKGSPTYGSMGRVDPSLQIIPVELFDQVQDLFPKKNKVNEEKKHRNEFFLKILNDLDLKEEQLVEYIIRMQDLVPLCKNGHGVMNHSGTKNVRGFNVPNFKCQDSKCSFERTQIRAFEMDEYTVPLMLCPVCGCVESFDIKDNNFGSYSYRCINCGFSFDCKVPSKNQRRRVLKKYYKKKENREKKFSQLKLT